MNFWSDLDDKADRARVITRGDNQLPIYAFRYSDLPRGAQQVVYNLEVNGPGGDDSWFYFDRDGNTEFKNKGRDLPAAGPYREYTVVEGDVLDSGALRIVHDETHNHYYFTPTHYQRELQGKIHGVKGVMKGPARLPEALANPFYRVTEIPVFKKA